MPAYVNAALDFIATDLYQSAGCYQGLGSYVLSPLSVLYAGAILYLGSNGPTKTNLDTALHFRSAFGNKSDVLKGVLQDTVKALSLAELHDPAAARKVSQIQIQQRTDVALVNGIFIDSSLKVNPNFQNDVTKILHGTAAFEDFVGNPSFALNDINNWAFINTFGKISDLLPATAVTNSSKLVLANTLYFKAAWNQHFPVPDKELKPFYELTGKVSQVTMLAARRAVPYAVDDTLDVQYIELPYKDDYFMSIILPRQKDGIRNCEHQFNTNSLRDLRAKVPMLKAGNQRLVNIQLPKFRIEGTFKLSALLAKAGVTLAVGGNADFSGMFSGGKATLSASYHKAFIDVDEWGTLAAAESVGALRLANAAPKWVPDYAPVDFIADHPFMFAIQHRPTESVLFIGRVEAFPPSNDSSDAQSNGITHFNLQ